MIANVLLAGAQKAGTTALFYYLKEDVCTPRQRPDLDFTGKEAHYFDDYYNQGISYYSALYQHCKNDTSIRLDATPNYMVHAERIHETYGHDDDIKILLILREPVSREISWYNHLLREYRSRDKFRALVRNNETGETKSFAEYMQDSVLPKIEAGLNYGLYANFVRQFLERFRSHQIWIKNYDDFRTNQTDFLLDMHEFLNLPVRQKLRVPQRNGPKVGNRQPISCATKNRLAEHYEKANKELYALLEQYDKPFEQFQYHCQDQ
jgi:hypothetical protein